MIPWNWLAKTVYRIKQNDDFKRFEDSQNLISDPVLKKQVAAELKADLFCGYSRSRMAAAL